MADKPKKTGKRRRQRRSLQKPLEHRVVQLHPRSDGGGRPAFTPTAEQRATVENLVTADF